MSRYQLTAFITLRLKLLFRYLRVVGLLRIIIVLSLLLVFIFQLIVSISQHHPTFLLTFYLLIAVTIHIIRNDFLFISHLDIGKRVLYGVEYNLAALPLSLLTSIAGVLWIIPIGHGIVTLVAFLPEYGSPENSLKKGRAGNWIPLRLFEWRATFRRYKWWILPSYIIGLLLSFYPYTLPIFIFYWSTFIAHTFNYAESKELMEEYSLRQKFLKQKIMKHSLFIHALLTPHYVLFLLFHFHSWYILIVSVLFIQTMTLFSVFFKYAHINHARPTVKNQVPVTVFLLLTVILPPVSVIVLYNYWRKAHAAIDT